MEARPDNTIVLVPSYNEAKNIQGVVKSARSLGMDVLVVDDGSTDDTGKNALDAGAMVIRNVTNMGKGLAIRVGLKHVSEKMNHDWMVLMDGDGQHHHEDVIDFMAATAGKDVDIIVGNRMKEAETMPFIRYWTNRFMSWTISRMCGEKIPDSQCGFRLVKTEALRKMDLGSKRFDIESEMLIEAASKGMKIISVPVKTIYGDEVSAIHPVRDTLKFIKLVFMRFLKR